MIAKKVMEEEIAKIETALKKAFTGLPVHSIDLMFDTPTEWTDLFQPHRYKWIDGKLHSVSYTLGRKRVLTEVSTPEPEWEDRLIPLEDLRKFMQPGMKDTLPPYDDDAHEQFQAGYRKCLSDLMEMLGINTCALKSKRDLLEETYGKKYT